MHWGDLYHGHTSLLKTPTTEKDGGQSRVLPSPHCPYAAAECSLLGHLGVHTQLSRLQLSCFYGRGSPFIQWSRSPARSCWSRDIRWRL